MIYNLLRFFKHTYKYTRNIINVSFLKLRGANVGKNVIIGQSFKVDNPKGLKIGNNVYIGDNFYANCIGGLNIDDGVIISNNCTIITYNHDFYDDCFRPYGLEYRFKPVQIMSGSWIGMNVNISGGLTIGNNSIVGLGTTVAKSIPEDTIFAGNRIIGKRKKTKVLFSLLEVRSLYNPFHYLIFTIRIKTLRKKKDMLTFDDVKQVYDKSDWLVLLYQYAIFHQLNVDFVTERLY